jgi:hypothetical protein
MGTAVYLVKWNYVLWICHIDESIAHVTFVLRKAKAARVRPYESHYKFHASHFGGKIITYLKINWKVDEIIGSSVILINDSQKQLTVVPVDGIDYKSTEQKRPTGYNNLGVWHQKLA